MHIRSTLLTLLLAGAGVSALAQSACSSDGQPAPGALLERFINADCEACWLDAEATRPGAGDLVLDWITPGSQGEDASLSAAATRDALERLQSLQRAVPAKADQVRTALAQPASGSLRVAHGLPLGGYIGTSIEWRPEGTPRAGVTAWLVLVETLPPGTEGTVVARTLVRNALVLDWPPSAIANDARRFFESRPMRIADGTQPSRLGVVGWVEDPQGRVLAAVQSQCAPDSGS